MAGHVALRTCIVCRRRLAKEKLFRFIADETGFLFYDPKGDKPGRGFYLCRSRDCLARYRRIPRKFSTKFRLREIDPESLRLLAIDVE